MNERDTRGDLRVQADAPERARASARAQVLTRLRRELRMAATHGDDERVPDFPGAGRAAERLFMIPAFRDARCIMVGAEAPQRFVRRLALERGVRVLVPTPGLADGFHLLEPASLTRADMVEASELATMPLYSRALDVDALPAVDAIVLGSHAVTPDGRRCGASDGYPAIGWGVLAELGHEPVPVATTVHELQLVDGFSSDPRESGLDWIVLPGCVIEVRDPPPAPRGIAWDLLSKEEIEATPMLSLLQDFVQSGRRWKALRSRR